MRRAESQHAVAHLSYQRLAAVVESRPNLVAQQELDDAHARDLSAEAAVSVAKATTSAAEQQVQVAQADEERYKTLLALNSTEAQIAVASARYDYSLQRAILDYQTRVLR